MANTSSAKKMVRKIAKRTDINRSRRSRMRTFLRKVEEAIATGDQAAAAGGPARRAARDHARRPERHRAQEHRLAEGLAPRLADSARSAPERRFQRLRDERDARLLSRAWLCDGRLTLAWRFNLRSR